MRHGGSVGRALVVRVFAHNGGQLDGRIGSPVARGLLFLLRAHWWSCCAYVVAVRLHAHIEGHARTLVVRLRTYLAGPVPRVHCPTGCLRALLVRLRAQIGSPVASNHWLSGWAPCWSVCAASISSSVARA